MTKNAPTIRPMTFADMQQTIAWAKEEGWNPGLHDAEIFYPSDPDGCLVLERDIENGAEKEMIGSGVIASYGGKFGFMGLFIIRKDLRRAGIGNEFWHQRLERLKARLEPGASIGMDGVFAMQHYYARGGFVFSHRNLRMASTGAKHSFDKDHIETITLENLPAILDVDKLCFGFERLQFLKSLIDKPDSHTLMYKSDSECVGYGNIRRCIEGWKIGPLFAKSPEIAEQLFIALSQNAIGEPVYLDVPEYNTEAMSLAAKYKMQEMFGCARMYYGGRPVLADNDVYGITTFEMG